MTVIRMAVVDNTSKEIVNLIGYDPDSGWQPPENTYLVPEADISTWVWVWNYVDLVWIPTLLPATVIIGSTLGADNIALSPGFDPNNPPPPPEDTQQPVADGSQTL